jgi:hypothetical protein
VGDRITLTLLIPDGTGFMEAPVQKNYTLVGILTDKLIYLRNRWSLIYPVYYDYPAGVLSAGEQIEAGGRAVVNCYGRYAGDAVTSFEGLNEFCRENNLVNEFGWPGALQTRYRLFAGYSDSADSSIVTTSLFFTIIALVLVCAACLGIVNAFSADLASRKRQIGLFRAVGATQKQIRAIFGREALLLALCAIPLGLALAGLTVWALLKYSARATPFARMPSSSGGGRDRRALRYARRSDPAAQGGQNTAHAGDSRRGAHPQTEAEPGRKQAAI